MKPIGCDRLGRPRRLDSQGAVSKASCPLPKHSSLPKGTNICPNNSAIGLLTPIASLCCPSSRTEAMALSRAYPGEIHLLLTDVKMPKLSGFDLAQQIVTERPLIRILVMSGEASNEIRKANIKLPFLR